MKLTSVETIRFGEFPNLVYLHLRTDEGFVGLGETFLGAQAVEAWIHETAAPYLLGEDPLKVVRHHEVLRGFVGTTGSGAENRGRSAVDIALWDLFGQSSGLPLHQLLGGSVRDGIRVYNTCAGYRYARDVPVAGRASARNWQLGDDGPYEDLHRFLTDAGSLARELLAQGITGMKMWPFDTALEDSGGHWITPAQLEQGLAPFAAVRDAVGSEIDIMVDLHTNWDVGPAVRIAEAVAEYAPAWVEDPVRLSHAALAQFRARSRVPVATGETLGTVDAAVDLLDDGLVDYLMFDPVWLGGVTEAQRLGAMAQSRQVPVTLHDCNGPVQFTTGVHLSVALPAASVQEFVRAYYTGWYPTLVTQLPRIVAGVAFPPDGPGLGIALRPERLEQSDVTRRVSSL